MASRKAQVDKQAQDSLNASYFSKLDGKPHPFEVNKNYFFRTVTHYSVGHCAAICGKFLVMTDATWIPDTGRFMNFLTTGKPEEAEPCGVLFVNMDAVVEAFPWVHSLQITQK
jgi:hypothetical protein